MAFFMVVLLTLIFLAIVSVVFLFQMAVPNEDVDDYDPFAEFDDVDLDVIYEIDIENNDEHNLGDGIDEVATEVAQPATDDPPAPAGQGGRPRRQRKAAIPRPKSTFSKEMAEHDGPAILLTATRGVATNQFVCDPTFEHSSPVKAFADTCVEKCSQNISPQVFALYTTILDIIWPAISAANKHSTGSQRRQAMWRVFHSVRCSAQFKGALSNFLVTLTGTALIPHLYLQIFARKLFERLVVLHEEIASTATAPTDISLSVIEQNALRYAAGYVVCRIPRKVKKLLGNEMEKVTLFISHMKIDSEKDTQLNYSREWVSTQTRGGLTLINDVTFLFFRQLEKIVRGKFPQDTEHLRDTDIRLLVVQPAMVDLSLLKYWDQINGGSLEEEQSLILLQLVIDFYVQIRGFSYARNVIEKFKVKNKKQEKGQKGLRTGLKRAHNPPVSTSA